MTHDLAQSIINGLGGLLRRAQVTRVLEGTFFAELHFNRGGQPVVIDARPSDAIALALRLGAPIFVAEGLFGNDSDNIDGKTDRPSAGEGDELTADELKRHLAQLRPEDFGRFSL